ncbi:MAG: FecR domain-containing protein [Betaproteobacteria bacterium]|nr:MAG: FecR domain-containing protein [Betaproteobacteria bacterium]
MSTTKERFLSSLVLALGIASLFPAANALGAAVVQESVGDVRAGATPAQSKPVAPNQRVLSGTLVTTAPGSRVVLRFDDGQLVALHENTQFRIEDFRFRPQESKADRAVFVLLRGALRAVTGALGERSPAAFSLIAAQSTIGIRGTDFMVAVATPAAYLSVLRGTVTGTNVAGTVAFGAGTFGSITSSTALAVPIPPSALPATVSSAFGALGALPITGSAVDEKLPETAAPRAQDASAFGLETANRARELKGDLGREFGKEVSEAAREQARDRIPGSGSRKP